MCTINDRRLWGHTIAVSLMDCYWSLNIRGACACTATTHTGTATGNVVTVKIQTASNSNDFVFVGTTDSTVTGYNTQLAVGLPNGGTYSWATAPTNGISISPNNSTSASLVTFTGNTASGKAGDTTETVTYTYPVTNGKSNTDNRAITLRIFNSLQLGTTKTGCPDDSSAPSAGKGYLEEFIYNIFTNPSSQQVESGFGDMNVAESVTVTSVTPSTYTFTPVTQDALTSSASQIYDCQGIPSSSALPSNLKVVATQTIKVGGILVRTNTLTYTNTSVTVASNGP